jgi:hypothetical protein
MNNIVQANISWLYCGTLSTVCTANWNTVNGRSYWGYPQLRSANWQYVKRSVLSFVLPTQYWHQKAWSMVGLLLMFYIASFLITITMKLTRCYYCYYGSYFIHEYSEALDVIWYDMIWHDMIYDMMIWYDIYLTAIGLTAGGSSTVHIYTQTIYRIQRTEHI